MKYGLTVGLIALALIGRLVPHPDNFTPVLAVAIFGGALLPRRAAYLVPLAAMFLSDLALGIDFTWRTAVIYACFAGGAVLGRWLARDRTWPKTLLAAAAGSLVFYLVTDFVFWLPVDNLYLHTPAGLVESYVMALPFLRNQLAGDLLWTASLFAIHDLVKAWLKLHQAQAH